MGYRQAAGSIPPEELLESEGRVPAYLQAIVAAKPEQAASQARLFRVALFGGTLPPSLKLAMGARVTELCQARYAGAHFQRLAAAVPTASADRERTAAAVRYAELLTRDIHGVSDDAFARLKSLFNDAQMIELTMATCFFNYFTRLTIGLGVVPEPWLATTRPRLPRAGENGPLGARVTLASDAELKMAGVVLERWGPGGSGNSLGVGIPNSLRAMIRVPDFYDAWMGGWTSGGKPAPALVPRTTLLQVSLAVSLVNGCRYCTVHQVVGLRRQGVEIGKLLALQKDDSVLTPEEKAAVLYARKLTRTPGALNDTDRQALQQAFPGAAAFEVLQQTCRFAFMNRFTDGLRLPSEDEAIHIYKETYGRTPK